MNGKKALRQALRRRRAALSPAEKQRAEIQANRLLKRFIRRGKRIAVYWPVGSEMRLDSFIRSARRRGAEVYLPYPAGKAKTEHPRGKSSLKIPQFAGRKIRAERLHAMLLPLVGINSRGYRLGQGGGYYDVSLGATRGRLQPKKIGIGFACQLCDDFPTEAHDIRADYFVCERGITRFSRK